MGIPARIFVNFELGQVTFPAVFRFFSSRRHPLDTNMLRDSTTCQVLNLKAMYLTRGIVPWNHAGVRVTSVVGLG